MGQYLQYTTDDFVMDDEFGAWALGFSSKESADRWSDFLNQHPEKKAEIEQAIFILKGLNSLAETPVSEERINLVWHNISQRKKPGRRIAFGQFLRYVAVFLVALIIGALGYRAIDTLNPNNQVAFNEISVPYGERSEIALYDGTKVWLNSGTRLKFPTSFTGNERRIYLDGEAFFEVSRKENGKPFVVTTPAMDLKVLGTRFNVNAYTDDKTVTATLEEGVIVAINNSTESVNELLPGYQISLDIVSGKTDRRKVDTELYTSWKENLLRFQDASFEEVVKKMERWYDVVITVQKDMQVRKLYTMTIKTESLREMLNLLAYTTPMNYDINQNKVFISRP